MERLICSFLNQQRHPFMLPYPDWKLHLIRRRFLPELSLKAYCNILRFRASFTQINAGKLFPQENFSDQSHFIREVKKLSGVSPKELKRNRNDRFIQFSVLGPE